MQERLLASKLQLSGGVGHTHCQAVRLSAVRTKRTQQWTSAQVHWIMAQSVESEGSWNNVTLKNGAGSTHCSSESLPPKPQACMIQGLRYASAPTHQPFHTPEYSQHSTPYVACGSVSKLSSVACCCPA